MSEFAIFTKNWREAGYFQSDIILRDFPFRTIGALVSLSISTF